MMCRMDPKVGFMMMSSEQNDEPWMLAELKRECIPARKTDTRLRFK